MSVKIQSKEEFNSFITEIQAKEYYRKPIGFGIARVDKGQINKEKILQAIYPIVNWNENFGSAAVFLYALKQSGQMVQFADSEQVFLLDEKFVEICLEIFSPFIQETHADKHKNIQVLQILSKLKKLKKFRLTFIFEDVAPKSVESIYMKLYALSLGKSELRSLNLTGAFGLLPNVAWVGNSPFELDYLRKNEIKWKMQGKYPVIDMVDKFPRFLQHIIPSDNTRILDTSKVRFGAHLAAGTTVMPGASYINFNAGTTGPVMVEGRISSSAIVGAGSDVGGGASILGVLSGTDGNPISIGENTLLGANSVTGIPLGDGCILDAGMTILAGTKITIDQAELDKLNQVNNNVIQSTMVKAKDLAGLNGIHFRTDSTNGKIMAKRSTREVKLNAELH
jgi:2,3,4,5-tetrahydropyridine-2,6-dicarboxylate N-succinyltransferase